MDPATLTAIANVINAAVQIGPSVIKGVEDALPFAQAIYNNLFNKTTITQADLDALDAQVQAMVDQALTPLPPDDPAPAA